MFWNARRQEIASRYLNEVSNSAITMQVQPDTTKSVFHLFVVKVENRDKFIAYLNDNGINPGLHYPVACHLQNAYKHLGYKEGSLPNAEELAAQCVSLPMYAELTDESVQKVIDALNAYEG